MRKYLTLDRLRQLGITVAQLPDADALQLIYDVSASLDGLTGQFFSPELEVHLASGDGSRITHHRELVPILKVNSLSVDVTRNRVNYYRMGDRVFGRNLNSVGQYDLTRFQIASDTKYRLLSILYGSFPIGENNIVMDGVFGYLDDRKTFETTLAVDLAVAATNIQLAETANLSGWIEAGDFVVVEIQAATEGVPALIYMDIVKAVSGVNLTVDAVQAQAGLPIAAGAKVYAFGCFPRPLREVMDALILRAWENDPRNSSGSGGGTGQLLSERVDNYSYQLESKSVMAQRAGGYGLITGDARLDKVLAMFTRPQYVGIV